MSETPSLEERIGALEEQNEGLKRVGVLLLVLVVVMGFTMIYQSNTSASAVSTEGLILNSSGSPRGALTAMPNGHLGLLFFDYQGNLPSSAKFKGIEYLDGFAIYDQEGNPRIVIGIDENDNPIMSIRSKDGRTLYQALPPTQSGQETASPAVPPQTEPTPQATATP